MQRPEESIEEPTEKRVAIHGSEEKTLEQIRAKAKRDGQRDAQEDVDRISASGLAITEENFLAATDPALKLSLARQLWARNNRQKREEQLKKEDTASQN